MTTPAVSVIIPTYNRAGRVVNAIQSVCNQTYRDYELIVVDDGSTDQTVEAVQRFGSKVHLLRQVNAGASAARNAGIRAARAPFIAFLDSDDMWQPMKLERQLPLMDDPNVVLSATDWAWKSEEAASRNQFSEFGIDSITTLNEPLAILSRFHGHRLCLPTWIVRRNAVLRVGGFDERFRVDEDTRLLFRLAFEGSFTLLPEVQTLLHRDFDEVQLTRANDLAYGLRQVPLRLEILSETYFRAGSQSSIVQCRLRTLLAHFLRRHAEHAALSGDSKLARRRALESLAFGPRWRDAVLVVAAIFSPWLLGYRMRRKQHKLKERAA